MLQGGPTGLAGADADGVVDGGNEYLAVADLAGLGRGLDDLKGLVVRVDSPGGSVMASEAIRRAIMRHKAKGIPVAVSMANVAASGGYWVSTPAQRIFAEPSTITGSIGIFAVVPTFERAAAPTHPVPSRQRNAHDPAGFLSDGAVDRVREIFAGRNQFAVCVAHPDEYAAPAIVANPQAGFIILRQR